MSDKITLQECVALRHLQLDKALQGLIEDHQRLPANHVDPNSSEYASFWNMLLDEKIEEQT